MANNGIKELWCDILKLIAPNGFHLRLSANNDMLIQEGHLGQKRYTGANVRYLVPTAVSPTYAQITAAIGNTPEEVPGLRAVIYDSLLRVNTIESDGVNWILNNGNCKCSYTITATYEGTIQGLTHLITLSTTSEEFIPIVLESLTGTGGTPTSDVALLTAVNINSSNPLEVTLTLNGATGFNLTYRSYVGQASAIITGVQ